MSEIDKIANTIRQARPSAAVRFLDAVEWTVQRLLAAPGSAALFESDNLELEGLRVTLVKGFKNHLLFYRARGDSICIEHVLHGARNLDALL